MSRPFIPAGPTRYGHQRSGLKRLIRQKGSGALLFDPGLGKTATVIDYLSVRMLAGDEEELRVLVVCPLVAVDTWVSQMSTYTAQGVNFWAEALSGSLLQRAEALASRGGRAYKRAFSKLKVRPPERGWHVKRSLALNTRPALDEEALMAGPLAVPPKRIVMEVINIDTLTQRQQVSGSRSMADVMVESVKRFDPQVAVIDESHKIKGSSSNASRLLARLTDHIPSRILLTGTVMPHSPLDVFGQWRFLDPLAFGTTLADGTKKPATFGGFKERFAQFGGWMGKEVVGFRNLDEMQDIMAKLAVVARKEDALDLPKTSDVLLTVELSPRERKTYNDLKKSLASDLSSNVQITVSSMLTQALRLRQVTSGHVPSDDGEVHTVGDSKVRTIRSLVQDTLAGEKRIVIFALFTHEIRALEKALASESGTEVMVIAGGTPSETRMEYRRRFGSSSSERMVMVAQIKTMSLAVNELVTASHAIFASMSQQRDDYVQARDRLNRIGQERPVTFWHAIAPGTVDEVILQAHRNRTDLESAMLRHIQDEDLG